MNEVGIGIIGCGTIALNAHIPAIDDIPEARVVAVSSRSPASALRAAERCGLEDWYTDSQKVLDDPAVEAVVLCSPPDTHMDLTIRAAAAGKHVLCEKPMARTLEECDGMIGACREANVQLMVAEMKRFNSGFRTAKRLLDDQIIGDIFMARYHTSYYAPFCRQGWWVVPEVSGGGQMMNELPHDVTVVRWLVGPVTQVGCMSNHPLGPPPEDNAVVMLRFENQAIGTLTTSWMAKHYNLNNPAPLDLAFDERLEIMGTEGALQIDSPFSYRNLPIQLRVYTEREAPNFHRGWNFVRCPVGDQYLNQMRNFIRCVRGREACEYPGEEGRAEMAVILAAMQSAETGQVVTLP
jgi:myo-inositol 2-dehydrogenase/D-chiro-inositol 1-dehydrogenase